MRMKFTATRTTEGRPALHAQITAAHVERCEIASLRLSHSPLICERGCGRVIVLADLLDEQGITIPLTDGEDPLILKEHLAREIWRIAQDVALAMQRRDHADARAVHFTLPSIS